jgi:hypothetical protein
MPDALRFVALALAVRAVALSLRLFGYARTSKGVRHLFAKRGLTRFRSPLLVAARVSRAAMTGPLPVGCLPRALLTAAILEGQGIEVAVRIGVRRDGDAFSAHAWVEHDGVPIAEPGEVAARFAPFDRDFRDGAAIRP